ncbi:DUF6461 domain-containing protein [Streptomyces sp. NBC_00028]
MWKTAAHLMEVHKIAAFALAEHLTQVRLTPAHLQDSGFVCGSAEIK